MKDEKIVIGEFEDEYYAEIARRDLQAAGIRSKILKNKSNMIMLLSQQDNAVQLLIPVTELEQAKKILERKFY